MTGTFPAPGFLHDIAVTADVLILAF